jgi:hypothetical protein
MRDRLALAAVPRAYADPGFVAERVCGALSRRPRLALDGTGRSVVREALPLLAVRVRAAASLLIAEVDAGMPAA